MRFVSTPPLFVSFRVFRGQTSHLLRIIHVDESRFQIRLIRRNPWSKNSVVSKIFRNFVPNFREPIANGKTTTRKGQPKLKGIIHMNTLIQTSIEGPRRNVLTSPFPRSTSGLTLFTLALACFAFSPAARAVLPSPGGGYPGKHCCGWQCPLQSHDRVHNTAIGSDALYSNTIAGYNTAIGSFALERNTRGTQHSHGVSCASGNTTGNYNTAIGSVALKNNTTGLIQPRCFCAFSNTTARTNIAAGSRRSVISTGNKNTATALTRSITT